MKKKLTSSLPGGVLNNPQGFTLIELLAVIIILAVIAIIATPIVLNAVDDAKESARTSKLKMYADSVKLSATEGYFTKNGNIDGKLEDAQLLEINNESTTCNNAYYLNSKVYLDGCTVDGVTVDYYIDGETEVTNEEYTAAIAEVPSTPTLTGTKISETVLTKYPYLALANTTEKGCATLGENNYTYMGGCYLKGLPTENYIWYSGFMYRIMGINSDGTVRLITEETVASLPWGAGGTAESYENSYIRDWLNEYFLSNLKETDIDILATNNFCQNTAIKINGIARTTCQSGIIFNDKAGLISVDEYNLAGAGSSYLRNDQDFWTISPYSSSYAWIMYSDGHAGNNVVDYAGGGVRAVINVNSTATINAGDGTLSDYYVLNETKTNTINVSLELANISSGEYITFAGKNYRVVSVNGTNVKMILDGYYTSDLAYGLYGVDSSTVPTCTLCTNSDVFNWLVVGDTNYASKLTSTTWYQGAFWTGKNYETNLNSTANSYTGYMGLIRVGEMLSGQSETILNPTRVTNSNSNGNAKSYWTATPYASTYAWYVNNYDNAVGFGLASAFGVRPIINVNSATTISGGNGTPNSPYQI